jgi:ABC-type phosphate transport system substrate-binding protein
MLAAITATPNSVGYLPARVGQTGGLAEALLDMGNGQSSTSQGSNLTSALVSVQAAVPGLFSSATADVDAQLSGMQLYGQPGAWPMPIIEYLFVYRNLTGYGLSGPLLRAFTEFMFSAEGSAMATAAGMSPMPSSVRQIMLQEVALSVLKSLTVVWSLEEAGRSFWPKPSSIELCFVPLMHSDVALA